MLKVSRAARAPIPPALFAGFWLQNQKVTSLFLPPVQRRVSNLTNKTQRLVHYFSSVPATPQPASTSQAPAPARAAPAAAAAAAAAAADRPASPVGSGTPEQASLPRGVPSTGGRAAPPPQAPRGPTRGARSARPAEGSAGVHRQLDFVASVPLPPGDNTPAHGGPSSGPSSGGHVVPQPQASQAATPVALGLMPPELGAPHGGPSKQPNAAAGRLQTTVAGPRAEQASEAAGMPLSSVAGPGAQQASDATVSMSANTSTVIVPLGLHPGAETSPINCFCAEVLTHRWREVSYPLRDWERGAQCVLVSTVPPALHQLAGSLTNHAAIIRNHSHPSCMDADRWRARLRALDMNKITWPPGNGSWRRQRAPWKGTRHRLRSR